VESLRAVVLAMMGRGGSGEVEYRGGQASGFLGKLAAEPWSVPGPLFRVSIPADRLGAVLRIAPETVHASALSGVVRLAPTRPLTEMEVRERVGELAHAVGAFGGWVVPERAPVGQGEFLPGNLMELNRGIRRIFDKAGSLTAGRSVPGA